VPSFRLRLYIILVSWDFDPPTPLYRKQKGELKGELEAAFAFSHYHTAKVPAGLKQQLKQQWLFKLIITETAKPLLDFFSNSG